MITILDIFGTFVFAISGAFRAVKHELDLLGVLVLSVATGVGGGMVRDTLLGSTPPVAFQDETYLLICFLGGLLVFIGSRKIALRWDCVMAADAIGLGVFAAIGAAKATACGLGTVGIIMIAAITATGGGVIRDMLVREIPAILKSDFYASASLIGGACFVITGMLGLSQGTRLFCAMTVTIILRILDMKYGIALPRVKSLPASPSQLAKERKAKAITSKINIEPDEIIKNDK